MRYLLTYHTDKGIRKPVNQDSLLLVRAAYCGQQIVLAVICDGMGGLECGETASAKVVYAFLEWFREDFRYLIGKKEFEDELYDSWEGLLQKQHQQLGEYGRKRKIRLGTTATAMLFLQGDYYIAHVGDSRIYEISDAAIQLTRDQTLGMESHVLLQGIGASKTIRPIYFSGTVKEDTIYLLCSDGLCHKTDNQELRNIFDPKALLTEDMMEKQGEYITKVVMERGERDNISVLLIHTLQNQKRKGSLSQSLVIEEEIIATANEGFDKSKSSKSENKNAVYGSVN